MNIYELGSALGLEPSNTPHWQPAYKVVVNGDDITARIVKRLMSLTLVDKRGFEADTLDITLSDHDGRLEMPPRGAYIDVWLGWAHLGLVYKGRFIAGCPEHSGAPDVVTINAISGEFSGSFTAKKERSFHKKTIGDIVKQIAHEHNWTPVIDPYLAEILLEHTDQQQESNANLLTRIAKENDAICACKAGKLLFFRAGNAKTASGQPIPTLTITRRLGNDVGERGDSHRFAFTANDEYTGVEATWYNKKTAKHARVTARHKQTTAKPTKAAKEPKGKKQTVSVGAKANKDDEKIFKLRYKYSTKEAATRAAAAKWQQLQRGIATFNINLARGLPTLFPETPTIVRGFKDIIDAQDWLATQVTHQLNESGYTTSSDFECASPVGSYVIEHNET